RAPASGEPIRVFTTRVDTIYGATCVILAPEHPLNERLLNSSAKTRAKEMMDVRANRDPGDIEKEGFFTGHYAVNPFSGEQVPIWVGNFVLMGYGTGAIMAGSPPRVAGFSISRAGKWAGAPGSRAGGGGSALGTGRAAAASA